MERGFGKIYLQRCKFILKCTMKKVSVILEEVPMKKAGKIIIPILVCCLIGFTYWIMTAEREVILSEKQIEEYKVYEVNLGNPTTKADILEVCTPVQEETAESTKVEIFSSDYITHYLYHYKEGLRISLMNDHLYLDYMTNDTLRIILRYDDQGLLETIVYDEKKNTYSSITGNSGIKIINIY